MSTSTEQRSRERVQVLADQLYQERYQYLVRIARRNGAITDADAEEAVGFALLSFIEKYDPASGSPPLGWATLTVQRACWAAADRRGLARRVSQGVAPSFSVPQIVDNGVGVEETVERAEYVLEAHERLAELKPAERRVLVLIAAGYSYEEIGQITGFSYTKTNRSAAEGRAALRSAMNA